MERPVGTRGPGRPAAVLTEREWLRSLGGAAAGRPVAPPPPAPPPPGDLTAALAGREHFPPFELAFSNGAAAAGGATAADTAAAAATDTAGTAADYYDVDGPCGYAAVDGDVEGSIELLSALRRARIESPPPAAAVGAGAPVGAEGDDEDSFDGDGGWGGGVDADDGANADVSGLSGLPSLDSSMAEQLPSLALLAGGDAGDYSGPPLSPIRPSSRQQYDGTGGGSADDGDAAALAAALAQLSPVGAPSRRALPDAPVVALATPPRPPSRGARSALLAALPAGGSVRGDDAALAAGSCSGHGSPSAAGDALPAWPSPRGSTSPSVCDRLAYIASGSPVVTPRRGAHASSLSGRLGAGAAPPTGSSACGECTPPRPSPLPPDAAAAGGPGGSGSRGGAARRGAALCDDVWTLSPLLSPFSSLPQKLSARRQPPLSERGCAGDAGAAARPASGGPASKYRPRRPSAARAVAELAHATTAADGSARALWGAGGGGSDSEAENEAPSQLPPLPQQQLEDADATGGIARALETALEEVQ